MMVSASSIADEFGALPVSSWYRFANHRLKAFEPTDQVSRCSPTTMAA
jgi:hypothetical protein